MKVDQQKLRELLDDHQTGHSEFQDDYLITWRHGGTVYGQYKQALRELYRRFRGLRELSCDREKLEIEIQQAKEKAQNGQSYEEELARVEFKRKSMQLEELERSFINTKREFMRFFQQTNHLKSLVGELTPAQRKKLDREMWIHKTKTVVALDLLTMGRLSKSAYELLGALPVQMRKPVIEFIESDGKHVREWYLNQSNEGDFEKLPGIEGVTDLTLGYMEDVNQLTTI
jgi:hypothetical protein